MRIATLVALVSVMSVACSSGPLSVSVLTIAEPQLPPDLITKLGSGPWTGAMLELGPPFGKKTFTVSLDSTSVALGANGISVPPALVVLGNGIEKSQGLKVSNVSLVGGDVGLGNHKFSAGGLSEGSNVRAGSSIEISSLAGFSGVRPDYFVLMKSTDDSEQRGAITFQSAGPVQLVLVYRAARGDLASLMLSGQSVELSATSR